MNHHDCWYPFMVIGCGCCIIVEEAKEMIKEVKNRD
jgi:hypothetical protein